MNCPKLLRCTRHKIEDLSFTSPRIVTDYEIDYYLEGERTIFIDNKKIIIEPNTLVFKKPGQSVSGIGKFNCYMLTLDFSNEKDNTVYTRNSSYKLQKISNSELITNIPSHFTPYHSTEIKNLLQLLSIYIDQAKKGDFDSNIMELLHLISADSFQYASDKNITSDDLTFICRYMQKHYNEGLTIEMLAEKIHLNKSYFIRKFNSKFGISPLKYLTNIKLSQSKLLLQDITYTIEDIAFLCGFCSSSHFSSIFKREYGMTPNDYRRSRTR